MKKILLPVLLAFVFGCVKHKDVGPSSVEGNYGYTTPDHKIVVTFDLVSSGDTLAIQNQTFVLDGTDCMSAATISGVGLPKIKRIRLNANDIRVTFPYNIVFLGGNVKSDFTRITFDTVQYTWPYTTTLTVTAAEVNRK